MKNKALILLILLTSCGSIKLNGVSIKKPHNKGLSNLEKACMIGGAVAGCAFVTHFNTKKQD